MYELECSVQEQSLDTGKRGGKLGRNSVIGLQKLLLQQTLPTPDTSGESVKTERLTCYRRRTRCVVLSEQLAHRADVIRTYQPHQLSLLTHRGPGLAARSARPGAR